MVSQQDGKNLYKFDNGVSIFREDLGVGRINRYTQPGHRNLHEPVEEAWLLGALSESKSGVFFDVGAAVGYYALLCRLKFPSFDVCAYDILEDHCSAVRRNARANGVDGPNLRVFQRAISKFSGFTDCIEQSYGSSIFPESLSPHEDYFRSYFGEDPVGSGKKVNRIEVSSLDEQVAQLGASENVVKIDVQGSEEQILEGSRRILEQGRVRYWIIGTHTADIHKSVVEYLQNYADVIVDKMNVHQQPDGLVVAKSRTGRSIRPLNPWKLEEVADWAEAAVS